MRSNSVISTISKPNEEKEIPVKGSYTFDEILNEVGSTGRWQIWITVVGSACLLFQALQDFFYSYIIVTPDYWCKLPGPDILTLNSSAQQLVKTVAIPSSEAGKWSSCSMYDRNYTVLFGLPNWDNKLLELAKDNSTPTEVAECESWVYDFDPPGQNSIVSEWDLVCDDAWRVPIAQAIYMVGQMIGSTLFGYLADKIGRKRALIPALFLTLTTGIASAFSPSFTVYLVLRCLTGIVSAAFFAVSYTIIAEVCSDEIRHITGTLSILPYFIGYFVLAAMSFGIYDWSIFQLAISIPLVVLLLYIWILPESPRWLMAQGRADEAFPILKSAAKWNRIKISDERLKSLLAAYSNKSDDTGGFLFKDLFRTPEVRKRTLGSYVQWFCNGLIIFGVSYNINNLGANQSLAGILIGIAQVAATVFSYVILIFLGRKPSLWINFFLGGISFIILPAIPKDAIAARVFLVVIGQFFTTIDYVIIVLYVIELFPNKIRNLASGTSWTTTQIGAMIASFIAQYLGEIMMEGPFIIYGILNFICGVTTFFLPETRGRELPDTIEDVENYKNFFARKPEPEPPVLVKSYKPKTDSPESNNHI